MSDSLSQEQIDSLLNSGLGGDLQNDTPEMAAKPVEEETSTPVDNTPADAGNISAAQDEGSTFDDDGGASKVFDLFCTQAGTVISTVLNKEIKFSSPECQKADLSVVTGKIDTNALVLSVPFTDGFEGGFYIVIPKKDVAVLSDLMMMGDGTAEYNDDHKDAISELFNQVMGAVTNALGVQFSVIISSGAIDVSEFDSSNLPFDIDLMTMSIISLESTDGLKSNLALFVPSVFCEQVFQNTSSDSSAADSFQLNSSELDDLSKITAFDAGNNEYESPSLNSSDSSHENIDMLLDIELDVSIELGRSKQSIKRILELSPGSIVELDRMAGEPVDLLVNNKVVAKGEVVVIDESFGIRIVSLISPEERIKSLQ
ncbi:MAG: flagellar motor switch protein FliN [Fibrobacter sp.]|nr:flagellar motor switch protein FliN [Fibrobacter sp.]